MKKLFKKTKNWFYQKLKIIYKIVIRFEFEFILRTLESKKFTKHLCGEAISQRLGEIYDHLRRIKPSTFLNLDIKQFIKILNLVYDIL